MALINVEFVSIIFNKFQKIFLLIGIYPDDFIE